MGLSSKEKGVGALWFQGTTLDQSEKREGRSHQFERGEWPVRIYVPFIGVILKCGDSQYCNIF